MSEAAFTSGVIPGGVFNKSDVKILVCYILSLCEEPFTIDQLAEVLIGTSLANFFEAGNALSQLCRSGNVTEAKDNGVEGYILTETGRSYLEPIVSELPFTLREKIAEYLKKMFEIRRSKKENIATYEKCEGGFMVRCAVMDKDKELMSLRLLVADDTEAMHMCDRFLSNTTVFYKTVIALMTGDITLCQNL